MKKLDKASDEEIRTLLLTARTHLGEHKKLEMDRDKKICFEAIFARLEPGVPPEQRSTYLGYEQVERFSLGGGESVPVGVGLLLHRDPDTG